MVDSCRLQKPGMSTTVAVSLIQTWQMNASSTFADRLRVALEESGRKPADVYKELKVSKATWYTWAGRGERVSMPESETAIRLARALGVNVRWLVTGKGEKHSTAVTWAQEQIDIAEAWPNLPSALREQIAVLIRHAAAELAPSLRGALTTVDRELQERANRLLEEAQAAARAEKPMR